MPDAKRRIKQLAVIAGVVLWLGQAGSASALGLGALHLRSALNQPLDARIELTSITPSERDSLSVRIAAPELFQRFGIQRSPLINDLRVDRAGGGTAGRQGLHLTSRKPVREPFLNVLIEAETSGGRALRAYTLLLDPPGRAKSDIAATTPNAVTERPMRSRRDDSAPASPRNSGATSGTGGDNSYGPVAAGDTLFGLADRLRPDGSSVNQMQVALFRANPQAFGGSMDTLLRGSTLTVPEPQTIAAIDPVKANKQVSAQLSRRAVKPPPEPATSNPPESIGEAPSPETQAQLADVEQRKESEATDVVANDDARQEVSPGRGAVGHMAMFGAAARARDNSTVVPDDGRRTRTGEPVVRPYIGTSDTAFPGNGVAATGLKELERSLSVPAPAGPSMPVRSGSGAVVHDGAADAVVGEPRDAGESIPRQGDVAAADETGWLSPRNILLLLLLIALVLALGFWRRSRQYKPVPLDRTDYETPTTSDALEQSTETVTPVPVISETVTPMPDALVRQAERQVEAGDFDSARATLEEGLANDFDNSALQDALLELDYLSGDAAQFDSDIQRFEIDRHGGGLRWARLAAMGRLLLPDDPRFVFGGPAAPESHESVGDDPDGADTPLPPTSEDNRPEQQGDDPSSAPSQPGDEEDLAGTGDALDRAEIGVAEPGISVDDESADTDEAPQEAMDEPDGDAFRLDTAGPGLGGYDWEDSEVAPASAREHDQSDDAGMAFELDTSDAPDSTPRSIGGTPEPVDTGEFDLDGPGPDPVDEAFDDHPAAIRLDLARMYMDMEDESAARPLLEEVLETGDASHREQAQTLLASMD